MKIKLSIAAILAAFTSFVRDVAHGVNDVLLAYMGASGAMLHAIGTKTAMKVYNPQLQAGIIETLTQVSQVFNQASNGTIVLNRNLLKGEYEYNAFFQHISGLVSRRDPTSVSAATDLPLAQDELIGVKVNRKVGPVAQTLDSFRKAGLAAGGEGALDFLIGSMIAKDIQVDQCDTALLALRAALANQSTVKYTIPTNGTLNTAGLVSGLAKRGDRATDVVMWVMHSKPYYDLVQSQITANITGVSNFNVAQAAPVTMNRPVLVTDSASLIVTGGTTNTPTTDYMTLGLVPGAVQVEDSEESLFERQIVTGLENLAVRLQGEFAYNLSLKGMKWDTTNGGVNPSSSAIGTGSNWDIAMTSLKDWGGIVIQSR